MPHRAKPDAIEVASRDEISALQLQRMKWSLAHAYDNVEHYRKSFDAAGVHPDDLKSLSDLSKFPFTVKDDLRQNYPYGMFAVPREQVVRVHASPAPPASPQWLDIHKTISTCGRILWPAQHGRLAAGRVILCM